MVAWKRIILFQYIYVTILLGISLIIVCAEEIHNVLESSQTSASTELDFGPKQGQALVESSIKFPTIGSFFSWMGSFDNLYNEYEQTFKEIATSIPQKEEFESQSILMNAYSSLLQCLEIMRDLHTIYKSSVSESNSDIMSENSFLNVSFLLKEFLIPCKSLLLKSFISLQDLVFKSGKIYSPTLLKSSERIMELYDSCWNIFTIIFGYITMLQQSMNILLRNRSEIHEKLVFLESKQNKSPLEQLQFNIYNRKLVDNNREKNLLDLISSLFEGNFDVSIQIQELESLILTENKISIAELEDSIKNTEKSMTCKDYSKEDSNVQLIQALKNELSLRSEDLARQTSGSSIYLQIYDQELTSMFAKLNLGDSQSDSTDEQQEKAEESKAKSEETDTKEVN